MNKKIILLLFISIVLVACAGKPTSETAAGFDTPIPNRVEVHQDADHDGHDHVHVDESQATADMQVALVASELVVGPNRFAVGLFDSAGRVVHDAVVHFHYFDLSQPDAPALESEADATRLQTPDGLTTIFAHQREFDRAGAWGVEVQARFADGTAAIKRIGFQVLVDSPTLQPGDKAPAVDTPTAADVNKDLRRLTSASEANPAFYELRLAEAIASGKPTALLFATPAFCQTRFCGPAYEITSALQKRYGDAVNFVHVEVFTGLPDPSVNNWEVAPAMTAFGLSTEPWLFLIDRDGTIVYRVAGVFTAAEVERQIQALLDGQ
ncbi:MAG: TlpA family protein disulfide reductase [Anaerolineae bacterium]